MAKKLKRLGLNIRPCPFCGSPVAVTRGLINAPFWFFKCRSAECGATVSFDNMAANLNPPKAAENWNRRAHEIKG